MLIKNLIINHDKIGISTEVANQDLSPLDICNLLPYNKKSIKLECLCYYCNSTFIMLPGRLKKSISGQFYPDRLICKSKECQKLKQRDINALRKEIGRSPRSGIPCSEESINKRKETLKTSENWRSFMKRRTGRTLIEFYGKEKGEKTIKALAQAKQQYILKNGVYPNATPRSDESKNRMRESRVLFLNKEKREKNYISPLSGEPCNYLRYIGDLRILYNKNNPKALEKASITTSIMLRTRSLGSNLWYRGEYPNVEGKLNRYLSSYELLYMMILNIKNEVWETNESIIIPYFNPIKEKIRHYTPDILLYKDDSIIIVEVKPSVFLSEDSANAYAQITASKIKALQKYCADFNYKYQIISEIDIVSQLKDLGFILNRPSKLFKYIGESFKNEKNDIYIEYKKGNFIIP